MRWAVLAARSGATARTQRTARGGAADSRLAPVAEDGSRPPTRGSTPQILLTSEELARAHRQALAAAKGGPQPGEVPLMLDPRSAAYREMTPFKSGATNEMALPGPKLSSVGGGRF